MNHVQDDLHDQNPQNSDSSKQESSQTANADMLQGKIEQLEKELSLLKDQQTRAQADFMNMMKRKEIEKEQAVKFANIDFLKDFLFVLDSLESGIQSFDKNHSEHQQMLSGLLLIENQILQLLEKFDIQIIAPVIGSAFDPNTSEAMSIQPSDQWPDQAILAVIQKGYTTKGRLLRPARVVVAKKLAEHP